MLPCYTGYRSHERVTAVKIYQHNLTPAPKPNQKRRGLLGACFAGLYGIFVLLAFCLFRYAHSIAGGLLALLLPAAAGVLAAVSTRDMQKSYVELDGSDILVVDWLFLQKREKRYKKDDIGHTELLPAFSMRLRGRRIYAPGMQYLVFYSRNGKHLFHVLATPGALEFRRNVITDG